jgi:3-phenylpropionate/trans-cinnamate dioxygenase ferredoxin subunit
MNWIQACRLDDIPIGRTRTFEVDGERLLLCRVDAERVSAVENLCTHDDGPLGEGSLTGQVIECPRHGARFDVTSGAVVRMPAATPLRIYPTRVTAAGWIEVQWEDSI